MRDLLRSRTSWRVLHLTSDAGCALVAWWAAAELRQSVPVPGTRSLLPPANLSEAELLVPLLVSSALLLLWLFGFYARPEPLPRLVLSVRLLGMTLAQALSLSGLLFLTDQTFPRSVVVLYVALQLLCLLVTRLLLQHWYRTPRRGIVLVGSGPAAVELARNVRRYRWHGLDVVGYVPAPGDPAPEHTVSGELGESLGSIEDLPRLLRRGDIQDVVLATAASSWQTRLLDRLAHEESRVSVLLVPDPFESLIGRMRYRWVHDIPLIEVVRRGEWRIYGGMKRIFDLGVGSLLLLGALPLAIAVGLAVRMTSPGPVFYRQIRVGQGRKLFTLIKFRTMKVGAEATTGEVLAAIDDPRLTPIGGWLRAARLDEIPQLLNVLAGHMSLVGPRPERPGFVEQYLAEVTGYAERFSLRPGITGLAQVNGDYHSTAENKLRYDLAYLANRSLWLDVSILFRTIRTVLTTRGT